MGPDTHEHKLLLGLYPHGSQSTGETQVKFYIQGTQYIKGEKEEETV